MHANAFLPSDRRTFQVLHAAEVVIISIEMDNLDILDLIAKKGSSMILPTPNKTSSG